MSSPLERRGTFRTQPQCPTCSGSLRIGLPGDATIEVVRETPIEKTIGTGDRKTRSVQCPSGHDAHVTFSTSTPGDPIVDPRY